MCLLTGFCLGNPVVRVSIGLFATPSEGEFLRPFCKRVSCRSRARYSADSSAVRRQPQRAPSQDAVGDEGGLGLRAPCPKGAGDGAQQLPAGALCCGGGCVGSQFVSEGSLAGGTPSSGAAEL